jgi:hypothetical protein
LNPLERNAFFNQKGRKKTGQHLLIHFLTQLTYKADFIKKRDKNNGERDAFESFSNPLSCALVW